MDKHQDRQERPACGGQHLRPGMSSGQEQTNWLRRPLESPWNAYAKPSAGEPGRGGGRRGVDAASACLAKLSLYAPEFRYGPGLATRYPVVTQFPEQQPSQFHSAEVVQGDCDLPEPGLPVSIRKSSLPCRYLVKDDPRNCGIRFAARQGACPQGGGGG